MIDILRIDYDDSSDIIASLRNDICLLGTCDLVNRAMKLLHISVIDFSNSTGSYEIADFIRRIYVFNSSNSLRQFVISSSSARIAWIFNPF